MENKRRKKINKGSIIIVLIVALTVIIVLNLIGSLFISQSSSSSSDSPSVSESDLLDKINSLQTKVNQLSSKDKVTIGEIADSVVVNGELRLPSEGLVYAINEDNSSYRVTSLGSCTDIDVVVPRRYNGLPVTVIGANAFENAEIDSINLWETVTSVGSEAFKGSTARFIYIYSTTPISIGSDAFPETVQGYFVPLHNVADYKAAEGWTAYSDKVVAIETPEALNTNIVNVYNALFAFIQNLMNNDASLQQAIENLGGVDAYLLSLITELQGYSQGLEYVVVEVDGVLGFGVSGIGTCTDTDIVIPPTYNDFPVLVISENAFSGNESITSVVIPGSIVQVKSGAFLGCSNLTSVKFLGEIAPFISKYIPDSLPAMSYAFSNTVEEFCVPAAFIGDYKEELTTYSGSSEFADKVVAIETLETLRAELEAVKQELAALKESQTEIPTETTVSEGE